MKSEYTVQRMLLIARRDLKESSELYKLLEKIGFMSRNRTNTRLADKLAIVRYLAAQELAEAPTLIGAKRPMIEPSEPGFPTQGEIP